MKSNETNQRSTLYLEATHPFVVAQLHPCVTPNIEEFTRISSNNKINSKFEQV